VRLEVLTSGIWQTNSTIIASAGACVVVDPAYFPRELDAIVACVAELGRAEAVIFTHGHWDHVMGHTALPHAPVWLSSTLEDKIRGGDANQFLEDARQFDSRWYVPRPDGYFWPNRRRAIGDDEELAVGDVRMRALHLPGHSGEAMGLVVDGVLLPGDYLSPCEIPFVEDAAAYRATLERLIHVLADVREVIPGHGSRMPAASALAIARADLDYLDALLAATDRDAALAIAWPRAESVVGMRDHHVENVAKRFAAPR
jgi:hydroxyacylglutathione hydrolase